MKVDKDMIGEKILNLRKQNEMTLKELSEKLNISIQHLSQIEKNKQDISRTMLLKLSSFFNISIDDLLDNEMFIKKDYLNNEKKENISNCDNDIIKSHLNLTESHCVIVKTNNDLSNQIIKVNDVLIDIIKQKI